MGKLLKKLKSIKGAVTIEATISLTTFLFLFMMIYSLVTICRTQAIVQVAINSAAKELSQYSYLYSLTGLNKSEGTMAEAAAGTRGDINEVAGKVSDVFNGIQSLGNNNITTGKIESPGELGEEFQNISGTLGQIGDDAKGIQDKVTDMIGDDPTRLLFGMAKIMTSDIYEEVKSHAGEAIIRNMVKKNLKRSENDNEENFCRAMGIQPGSYFGQKSYFNGIDFSHSQLLPYGSSEIVVVANYKMKLMQLLPIDIELHFTQTAVTTAWMQGDVDIPDGPKAIVGQRGDSIWNEGSGSERERLIRNMGVKDLKENGFYSVSGNNYIHGYCADPQTLAVVRSYNPLEGVESVDSINMVDLVDRLTKISSQVESSTDNIHSVRIKKPDANGNLKTEEVNCDGDMNLKVILVIPEDPKLKEKLEEALKSVNTDVEFEFLPGYGTVYKNDNNDEVGG